MINLYLYCLTKIKFPMKIFKMLTLLTIPFFFMTSCEDKKGLTSSDLGDSQGFIKVTLDGKTEDGESIDNESFEAKRFGDIYNNRISEDNNKAGVYNIYLKRVVNITKREKTANIDIKYYTDGDSAKLTDFDVNYMKELEDQKRIRELGLEM